MSNHEFLTRCCKHLLIILTAEKILQNFSKKTFARNRRATTGINVFLHFFIIYSRFFFEFVDFTVLIFVCHTRLRNLLDFSAPWNPRKKYNIFLSLSS